jgi:hypothetical protein
MPNTDWSSTVGGLYDGVGWDSISGITPDRR